MLKNYSKTGLLLLVVLLGACGTQQTKIDGPTPQQQRQMAAQMALLKQEYEQALTTMRQANYPLAIKQFVSFTETHPKYAGAYANLGILYHKMNQLDKSEKALSKAVELNPKHAAAQNRLGMVYRELGRFDDALAAYNQAILADDSYSDAYLNLGVLYDLYLFDGKKALEFYSKYQKMTGNKDSQVVMWISELIQRTQQASQTNKTK